MGVPHNGRHLAPAGPQAGPAPGMPPGAPPDASVLPNAGLMPVPVAPVPVNLVWGQVQVGPNVMILLTVQTPSGVQSYFLDPKTASTIGGELKKMGDAGDILIAPTLPPDQQVG